MAVTIKFLPGTASTTAETELTEINFGNIIRGNSAVKDIKIGNTGNSTAESVALSVEGGASAAWKTLSKDGVSYTPTLALPDIPASGLSGVVNIKSTVPGSATTGLINSTLKIEYVYI